MEIAKELEISGFWNDSPLKTTRTWKFVTLGILIGIQFALYFFETRYSADLLSHRMSGSLPTRSGLVLAYLYYVKVLLFTGSIVMLFVLECCKQRPVETIDTEKRFTAADILKSLDQMTYLFHWDKKTDIRNVKMVTENCTEFYGVEADDVLSEKFNIWNFIHPDDIGPLTVEAQKCHASGDNFMVDSRIFKRHKIWTKNSSHYNRLIANLKDANHWEFSEPISCKWVRTRSQMFQDNNECQSWLGMYEDISDLKEKTEELNNYRAIANALESVISECFVCWFYCDDKLCISNSGFKPPEKQINLMDWFKDPKEAQRVSNSVLWLFRKSHESPIQCTTNHLTNRWPIEQQMKADIQPTLSSSPTDQQQTPLPIAIETDCLIDGVFARRRLYAVKLPGQERVLIAVSEIEDFAVVSAVVDNPSNPTLQSLTSSSSSSWKEPEFLDIPIVGDIDMCLTYLYSVLKSSDDRQLFIHSWEHRRPLEEILKILENTKMGNLNPLNESIFACYNIVGIKAVYYLIALAIGNLDFPSIDKTELLAKSAERVYQIAVTADSSDASHRLKTAAALSMFHVTMVMLKQRSRTSSKVADSLATLLDSLLMDLNKKCPDVTIIETLGILRCTRGIETGRRGCAISESRTFFDLSIQIAQSIRDQTSLAQIMVLAQYNLWCLVFNEEDSRVILKELNVQCRNLPYVDPLILDAISKFA